MITINNNQLEQTWRPTKSEISRLANEMIQQVNDGNIDASKATVILNALAQAIDTALKNIKSQTVDDLYKYPSKQVPEILGASVELKEAGVKYDYSACGDSFLLDMLQELEALDAKIKDRQKFLRSIKDVEMIVDTRTGEICELRPPTKTSVTTFVIKYPND